MKIQKLPPDVATRIAAGEVVERPLSVVKELVENALDAGARRLSIFLSQGGKASIVVEDDGRGIAFDDLPLSMEHHATSKISSIEEMERIVTLGFRGEALPSIAAVSRFEIRSRSDDESRGGLLRAEGGHVLLHSPLDLSRGTRVQVDDLFFNLPARRKFLKGASSELRRVLSLVQAYAMAYPDRAFLVQSEGRTVFLSSGDGDVASLLRGLWGDDPPLRHLEVTVESYQAQAWWQPAPGRGKADVAAFVNRRRVQEGLFRAALNAPGGDVSGQWLLLVEGPPEEIDVNIHPAKTEIRFRRSGPVFEAFRRLAMGLLDKPQSFSLGLRRLDGNLSAPAEGLSLFSRVASGPEERGENFLVQELSRAVEESPAPRDDLFREGHRYLGRLKVGYLLFETGEGLLLVDSHAAHERICFERFHERGWKEGESQPLAFPLILAPSLAQRVDPYRGVLEELGFRFDNLETGRALIAVPALPDLERTSAEELLRVTVDSLDDPQEEERFWSVWRRWATLACKAAVKLTTSLEPSEAERLLDDLFRCHRPWACPHGRPTTLAVTVEQLARHFGRE